MQSGCFYSKVAVSDGWGDVSHMTVIEQLNAGDSFTLTEVQENSFHGKPGRGGGSLNLSVVFSFRTGFSANEWAPAVTLPAQAPSLSKPEGPAG